jgi:TonB family protein
MNALLLWSLFGVVVVVAPSLGSPISQSDTIARDAYAVLDKRCGECHGDRAIAGFTYRDYPTMLKSGNVTPRNLAASKIYQRISMSSADGQRMPPVYASDPTPLTDVEKASIKAWIDAGAPEFKGGKPAESPTVAFVTEEQILAAIEADLKRASERDRPYLRYFTLTHLYNAGASDGELRAFRVGLSKLLNSLSWQKRISVPEVVDPAQTILRIDMRRYSWTAETWKRVLAAYPYSKAVISPIATRIYESTTCELAYIRADWFVARAATPPLYHDLLGLPANASELETKLGVDVAKNIHEETAVRAGLQDSGVSRNNRVVERHESPYGAYWRSYDFSGNTGEQNIFKHPIDFKAAGGEIIFNLPNGLQGYMLVDDQGKRIDVGPIGIVNNKENVNDPEVRNGLTCMSCHVQGMKWFGDNVRAVVEATSFDTDFDRAKALALYIEKSRMDSLLDEDTRRFADAVRATGAEVSEREPIVALQHRYDAALDVRQAAAELGINTTQFSTLLNSSASFGVLLGPLKTIGGRIKRDAWEGYFTEVHQEAFLPRGRKIKIKDEPMIVSTLPTRPVSPTIPQPETQPEPPRERENGTAAQLRYAPTPKIPANLRSDSANGTVRVRFTIKSDSSTTVEMISSSIGNTQIDQVILDTLRRWKWKPATKDGKPVESTVNQTISVEIR